MMKRFFFFLLLLIQSSVVSIHANKGKWSVDNMVDPFTTDTAQYIWDELGYLSDSAKASLNVCCDSFNHQIDMELAIVLLNEINDDPFEFGLNLYNHWGLGRNSRGLLLLILVDQHQWQFISGEGAEGVYPDALLFQVGTRKLVPRFRQNDYAGGIQNALTELYRIGLSEDRDFFYETNGYDTSHFASFGTSDTSYNNAEDEDTWFDIMISTYAVILCIIGIICSVLAHDMNPDLKKCLGSFETSVDPNYAHIRYNADQNPRDIGVWSGKGYWRYFLIDVGFAIVAYVSFLNEDSFLYVIIGLAIYLTYWAIVWGAFAWIQVRKAGNTTPAKYIGYTCFSESISMNFYRYVIPWVGLPLYWLFRKRAKKAQMELLSCPICSSPSTINNDFSESKLSLAEQFEKNNKIYRSSYGVCRFNHTVILSIPDEAFGSYKMCEECKSRTAIKTKSEECVKATYKAKGQNKCTYRCKNCHKEFIRLEETPMLTESSGGYSYGGSSGGHSGGSRGGGHSSGGGARGGW